MWWGGISHYTVNKRKRANREQELIQWHDNDSITRQRTSVWTEIVWILNVEATGPQKVNTPIHRRSSGVT
jgi:hypothetical protein